MQLDQLGAHLGAQLGVEVGERLVEQEGRGLRTRARPSATRCCWPPGELKRLAVGARPSAGAGRRQCLHPRFAALGAADAALAQRVALRCSVPPPWA